MSRRTLWIVLLVLAATVISDAQSSFRVTRGRTGTVTEIVPPPDPGDCATPMASGLHPRLGFTECDIPDIKENIDTYHQDEFQDLIDMVANPTANVPAAQRTNGWRFHWTAQNFGFLAQLGGEVGMPGYNWPDAIDTPDELCDAAYAYYATTTTALSTLQSPGNYEVNNWGITAHGYMSGNGGQGRPNYLVYAQLYDYCYDFFDASQKLDVIDSAAGRWAAYQAIIDANAALATAGYFPTCLIGDTAGSPRCATSGDRNTADSMVVQNQNARSFELYPMFLAFVNDPELDAYDATLSAKWESFGTRAMRALEAELDDYWPQGPFGNEGTWGYESETFQDAEWPIFVASTALGEDWYTKPFFSETDSYIATQTATSTAAALGRGPVTMYYGTGSTDGIQQSAKMIYVIGQRMARSGLTTQAGVLRYVFENWLDRQTATDAYIFGGEPAGTWCCAARGKFLGSWDGISPVNPNTVTDYKATRNGLDVLTFRQDGGADATLFFYFTSPYTGMSAHSGILTSRFDIYKDGALIKGFIGNGKSGPGSIKGPLEAGKRANYNSGMYIRQNGTLEPLLPNNGGAGWVVSSTLGATLGFSGATKMSNTESDYLKMVNVDPESPWNGAWMDTTESYTAAYSTGTSNEMVYLRGPDNHEFILRMDRVTRTSPASYTRSFFLPFAVEPTRNDGLWSTNVVSLPPPGGGRDDRVTITSSAAGSPGTITLASSADSFWATSTQIQIKDHTGTTPSLNGVWTVTRVSATVWTLNGSSFTGTGSAGTASHYLDRDLNKYTSANATKFTITNTSVDNKNFGQFTQDPTNAKLYIQRVIGPATYTITCGGGDYLELVYADWSGYRNITIPSSGYPSDRHKEHLGWGRCQEDSDNASSEEASIWAFQPGLASTMGARAEIVGITSTGSEHIGAHVKDAGHREWVNLWVKGYANANARDDSLEFSFTHVNGTTYGLLHNMTANLARGVTCTGTATKTCVVGATGGGATTVTVTSRGVLEFKLTAATNAITPGVE